MHLNFSPDILYKRNGILDEFMEKVFDMSMIVNKNGVIIHVSSSIPTSRNEAIEDIVGRNIDELYNALPFKKVLKSGKSQMGIVEVILGRKILANIFPVVHDNMVIGALGTMLFKNLSSLKTIIASASNNLPEEYNDIYDRLSKLETNYIFDDFIGQSQSVLDLINSAQNAAKYNHPVLILGETGTGKEIISNAIHSGKYMDKLTPFIKINCNAIPENLLESELFGHSKGAFTGANENKKGKFELASGGSILLDEIGDMDQKLQAKLLRVLEQKEFERVGGTKVLPLNARIISSTNKDLYHLSMENKFRLDLYYRLNTIEITIPPLRERKEDIPLLIAHFINVDQLDILFTQNAMEVLIDYYWPGNVRELKNVLSRLDVIKRQSVVNEYDLTKILHKDYYREDIPGPRAVSLDDFTGLSLAENEKNFITKALVHYEFNISKTAESLGISRPTLYSKIDKYKIKQELII